jgi:hypothetical protein
MFHGSGKRARKRLKNPDYDIFIERYPRSANPSTIVRETSGYIPPVGTFTPHGLPNPNFNAAAATARIQAQKQMPHMPPGGGANPHLPDKPAARVAWAQAEAAAAEIEKKEKRHPYQKPQNAWVVRKKDPLDHAHEAGLTGHRPLDPRGSVWTPYREVQGGPVLGNLEWRGGRLFAKGYKGGLLAGDRAAPAEDQAGAAG